jgi:hypothetical protein
LTAGVPIAVALTIAAVTGGAGAPGPARAWLCIERPREGIDAKPRPLFVFIGARGDDMRARRPLGEGKKVCAEVPAGAVAVDVRMSPTKSRRPPSSARPLRLHLAPEVFLHLSVVRSPPTSSRLCPWTMHHSIDDPTVPRKNDLADLDFVILPALTSYDKARKVA